MPTGISNRRHSILTNDVEESNLALGDPLPLTVKERRDGQALLPLQVALQEELSHRTREKAPG